MFPVTERFVIQMIRQKNQARLESLTIIVSFQHIFFRVICCCSPTVVHRSLLAHNLIHVSHNVPFSLLFYACYKKTTDPLCIK
jgi:hypothetical protein